MEIKLLLLKRQRPTILLFCYFFNVWVVQFKIIFKCVAAGPAGSLGGLRLSSLKAALFHCSNSITLMASHGSSWGARSTKFTITNVKEHTQNQIINFFLLEAASLGLLLKMTLQPVQ